MQQNPIPDEMARLQVDISEELKQKLKVQAAIEQRTMSEVVEAALQEYLAKTEKQGGK